MVLVPSLGPALLHAFPLFSLALRCLLLSSIHANLLSNGAILSVFMQLPPSPHFVAGHQCRDPPNQGHPQSRVKKTTMTRTVGRSRRNDSRRRGLHEPGGLSSLVDAGRSLRTAHPVVSHGLPRPRRKVIIRPSSHHHLGIIATATQPPFVILLAGLFRSNKREEE